MSTRGFRLVAGVGLCACGVQLSWAYITGFLTFRQLAAAPVIATGVILQTSRDPLPAGSDSRVVTAHATVRVLRSFPPSAFTAGEVIRLDYEQLSESASPMDGPDLPHFKADDAVALPLNLNPAPSSAPWRLIWDEGMALVIPAIADQPPFAGTPKDGREFLLREIASTWIGGTRPEMLAEAYYVQSQKDIGADVMMLLETKLSAGGDRWPVIGAALFSALPMPRPSTSGPLLRAVLEKLGPSQAARETLIHNLLANSDIASWGVGLTLREYAQEPSLTSELRTMLKFRRPGSLPVARDILIAGQRGILGDALTLSFSYVANPPADPSELQAACWIIRDFGSDAQFGQLAGETRRSQYNDRQRYDRLWRDVIWSENDRERAVLEILLKDDRWYQPDMRYSDIARGELARIRKRQP
jgi:hypothetical protein